MATAKKTPSGQWKCRVYSHTSQDGKKHYRAFTAPTKQEAEQEAARFSSSKERAARVDLTVNEAIDGYIKAKQAMLSPSTVLGYKRMAETRFDAIGQIKIRKLTNSIVQTWVSELSRELSPHTVGNIYGLFAPAVALYAPEISFHVKLPSKQKNRSYAATDAQVMSLFEAADPELKKCIALAAFGSLRRGEICAVKYGDIQGNMIHVHADMILGPDGWEYKPHPKTADSDRFVPVPDEVIDLLGDGEADQFVVKWKPDTITKRFIDLRKTLGLSITFHGLRHYYASIAATLIPDLYAENFGGWRRGSRVMKEVYQQRIDPLEKEYADTMRKHFSGMMKTV